MQMCASNIGLASNHPINVLQSIHEDWHEIEGELVRLDHELFPPSMRLWQIPVSHELTVVVVPSAGKLLSVEDLCGALAGSRTRQEAAERVVATQHRQTTALLVMSVGGVPDEEKPLASQSDSTVNVQDSNASCANLEALLASIREMHTPKARTSRPPIWPSKIRNVPSWAGKLCGWR